MSERQLPWRVLAPNLDEKHCRVVDMFEHPNTHEALPARTAEAVERHMHKILDGLNARLPKGVRR